MQLSPVESYRDHLVHESPHPSIVPKSFPLNVGGKFSHWGLHFHLAFFKKTHTKYRKQTEMQTGTRGSIVSWHRLLHPPKTTYPTELQGNQFQNSTFCNYCWEGFTSADGSKSCHKHSWMHAHIYVYKKWTHNTAYSNNAFCAANKHFIESWLSQYIFNNYPMLILIKLI